MDVSLEIHPGERLALVGENGAGKSSLMNVLYGLYQPDQGEIRFDDQPVRLRGPKEALARGVGMVHQHFMLVPNFTVAQNVVLGREPHRFGRFDHRAACAQVGATCERFGFRLDPTAPVSSLSVGAQQKVEIVKALHRGARVLILDEPTAVLTPQESDELFTVCRALADSGHTVIFISHKLPEVLAVASRIAVMRHGRKVAEVRPAETSAAQLAALMVGSGSPGGTRPDARPVQLVPGAQAEAVPVRLERSAQRGVEGSATTSSGDPPSHPALHGDAEHPGPSTPPLRVDAQGERSGPSTRKVLDVEDLHARSERGLPAVRGATFFVNAGEIVGIAGVDGNGQTELAQVLTGLRAPESGAIRLLGDRVEGLSPGALRRRGVAHVPEDRLLRGMIGALSVEENLSLGRGNEPTSAKGTWIDPSRRRARALDLVEGYDVRPRDPTARMGALSGGNQQKVVLARELDSNPRLLVVVQPTRGLDFGAVAQVHARLRQSRAAGAAVLLISLELDELFALCDRLYVLREGKIEGALSREAFEPHALGALMLGAKEAFRG